MTDTAACDTVLHMRPLRPQARSTWVALMHEVPLVLTAYLLYFAVRGQTEGSGPDALGNADGIIRFERLLSLYWESDFQRLIIDHQPLIEVFNAIYIYGHWPVIVPVAIWLFLTRPNIYVVYRNAFFLSGIVGLALFLFVPVAPPRLAEIGLVDTVTLHSEGYRVFQPPAFVNQYAAFPSLHFGWNLLVGIVLATHATSGIARAFGMIFPIAMAFAVVATANHFILDVVAGAAISLAALGVSQVLAASFTREPSARTLQGS